MRNTLLTLSLISAIIFGTAFSLTFADKALIEKSAKKFIAFKIEKEFSKNQALISKAEGVSNKLNFFKEKYSKEIAALKKLGADARQITIKVALDKICDVKCLESKGVKISEAPDYFDKRLSKLKGAKERLGGFVKGKYYQTLNSLIKDIRIFSGINLFIFLILIFVLTKKSFETKVILLPSILMLTSTFASISAYVFGQNWFYTIIFNDYTGYGYLVWVGVILGFLLDIIYNGASITNSILEGLANFLSCISFSS